MYIACLLEIYVYILTNYSRAYIISVYILRKIQSETNMPQYLEAFLSGTQQYHSRLSHVRGSVVKSESVQHYVLHTHTHTLRSSSTWVYLADNNKDKVL